MNFTASILKSIKRIILQLIPDKTWIKYVFRNANGYNLNLDQPVTFCEKIQWLKLYNRRPEYIEMVDKYLAKKYVADKIGDEHIIPTLGVWDRPEDIDFDSLPNRFVLKTTHNSGGVLICRNKEEFDRADAIRFLNEQLRHEIYYITREWPYKNVKRRIIAEQFMDTGGSDLTDYKFFCFDGEPLYCQVIANRSTNETIDFYDPQWNHQEFNGLQSVGKAAVPQAPPQALDKMLAIARILSKGHVFLRVDLYDINNKIYFGELTFYPNSGLGTFTPEIWNKKLGDLINLNPLRHK